MKEGVVGGRCMDRTVYILTVSETESAACRSLQKLTKHVNSDSLGYRRVVGVGGCVGVGVGLGTLSDLPKVTVDG